MINIIRPKEVPASLQSQEIRDYLEALANHRDDPEHFSKPEKPPAHRNRDLLEAFDRCFFSKCYLTEQKFANSWALDVEHFEPRKEKPELTWEWNNLFPAEHKANMMKPRNTPSGGYLNPCSPDEDVENDIVYVLLPSGKMEFEAKEESNIKAKNTANLLNLLHNGKDDDEDSRKNTEHLRSLITKKYIDTLNAIIEWKDAKDEQEKFESKTKLRHLLSRKSSFTAIIRSTAAVRKHVPKNFLD